MGAVSGCWALHSGCYHTAQSFTGEEMRSDRHNDSLWRARGTWTSQVYMVRVAARFPSTAGLINMQAVGAETGSNL